MVFMSTYEELMDILTTVRSRIIHVKSSHPALSGKGWEGYSLVVT